MTDPAEGGGFRGIVVAVSPDGIIGIGGRIPWHYPADLRRFRRLTWGSTVILGRCTFESLGSKPLEGRRNIVLTRGSFAGIECYRDLESALRVVDGPLWFIGGERVYAEALPHAELIDMTCVPDVVGGPGSARFPPIDASEWEEGPLLVHEDDARLRRRIYRRRRVVAEAEPLQLAPGSGDAKPSPGHRVE